MTPADRNRRLWGGIGRKMDWIHIIAAGLLAAAVLAGGVAQFAHYRLQGVRSRNRSYLLAASGLFLIFFSMLTTRPVRLLLAELAAPGFRFGCFLAGCLLLLGAVGLYLYLTYLRPGRLRFEDELLRNLPRAPRRPHRR